MFSANYRSAEETEKLLQDLESQLTQLEAENRRLQRYRDRYIDLYDSAPVGYAAFDEDGYVQEINLAGAAMLRADRDTMIGYPFADYLAKGEEGRFREHIEQCLRDRRRVTAELRLAAKGGQVIHSQFQSIPVDDPDTQGFLCKTAITDISERVRLEQALRFTQFSVDHAGDAVFSVAPDGRFLYVNARACEHLGYSREELLSMTVHDIDPNVPPDDWPKRWEEMKQRSTFTFESQHRTKEGRLVPVEITVNHAEFEGQAYHCAFVRDITVRKRVEERLARLNSLKEQLLAPKSLSDKLKLITNGVVEVFGADFARIWVIDEGDLCNRGCRHAEVTEGPGVCRDRTRCLHLVASSGRYSRTDGSHRRVPLGAYKIGRVASGEEPKFITNDVTHDLRVHDREWAASLGLVSFAGYRLLSPAGTPLGVLALFSKRPIDASDEALLEGLAHTTSQVIRTGMAEERLIREKSFTDIVIDSIPGLFYVLDNQGRFQRWNNSVVELTGLDADTLCGTDALVTIAEEDRQRVAKKIQEVFEKGHAEVEARLLAKDGVREFWFTGRRMDVGSTAFLVGSGVDISGRKRAEEGLREAKASAESANQAKDHFLAVLSHELRTPLTPVTMGVSMLLDRTDLAPPVRESLEMIRGNVEMEARLIDDLLDVTRIARGKIELKRNPTELDKVIHGAVEVCRPDIEARGLEFAVDMGPGLAYWIEADISRLQQVFWNLLKNAVKFTPYGGCVGIRCRPEGNAVVAEVSDSGIGIEPEALSRVFNAFEQVERSVTQRFGGLGLGLAISKALVEMHGGRIEAFSEGRDKGATFRIRLPLTTPPVQPELPVPMGARQRPERPLHVLLVEDHGVTAKLMRMVVSAEGHYVETAGDVATALQLAAQQKFDLLLSDLGLPDGSGHDLIRQLRQRGHRFPGIALSGYGQEEDIQRSREAGFAAHLTKPASRESLLQAVTSVTSQEVQMQD